MAIDEPGIDLSNPPSELGEQEQMVMDLLNSKPWFVTQIVKKAAPSLKFQGPMGHEPQCIQTGPGELTITIIVPT